MAKQAALQKKWNAENALVPGAAPYVAPGGRRRKANAPPADNDMAKKLKEAEAGRKKAEAEAKRLRDAKALKKPVVPAATGEVKTLEKKLTNLETVLADDPTDKVIQDLIKAVKEAIEKMKPSQVLDLAQLHAQLNEVNEEIQKGVDLI